MRGVSELTLDLERAALTAIKNSYDDLNGTFFRWRLVAPSFELVDSAARLGRWVGNGRRIEIARSLLLDHGWGVLIEVLKHEMAHQFVAEVLAISDEASHGPAFRQVCEERGFDARAAGLPQAGSGEDEQGRVLDRIAKLLALAESPNEHEAQAAMSAARRLMLKYNLDAVKSGVRRSYTYRHLGEPSGRIGAETRLLAALLAEHFFVEVIWVPVWRPLLGKRGTVLEVCGTVENVELAAYVYTFMGHTSERLWREHKRAAGVRSDSGRQSFLAGVMSGFKEKLTRERGRSEQEALVWQGDAELSSFFRTRHPRIRHQRYLSRAGSSAYADGRRAGQNIVLHRGVRAGSSGGSIPLLPSRR